MIRKTALTVGLVAGCLWCLFSVAGADSAEGQPHAPDPYKPVAPVSSLMYAQAHHFGEFTDLIREADAEDRFMRMRMEALVLAELCNVNAFRAQEDDYRTWAAEARDVSLQAAEAASKRNADAAKGFARDLKTKCRACHDKYKD
ncbi:MAG: hypothetical protein GY778_21025 [bacterium]|nr:hypothetical protein [bacterium]